MAFTSVKVLVDHADAGAPALGAGEPGGNSLSLKTTAP